MKYTQLYTKTNKSGKDFDSINATYLINGGFIDQTMAGVYTFLPLGLRVLNKIEQIVREEMNTIGVEVLMPALSPFALWEQTGRLDTVDVLMKTSGANEASRKKSTNEYVLNSTHEEIITPIAKKFNRSYRDFPFAFYQIQSKFRNEARAKSGILRGREFRMKDLYSFHTSEADLKTYYEKSKEVYTRVFERMGLGHVTYLTLASGGDFTKDYSHEFQVKCQTGEDEIYRVPSTGLCFNKEVTPSKAPAVKQVSTDRAEYKEVEGKGMIGVEVLATFLNISVELTTKTMLYQTDDGKVVAAVIRGGYDINEEKLTKIIGCNSISLADQETVKRVTNAEIGYAGPINLAKEVAIYFDDSCQGRVNFECGANKTNFHSINVNFGRDLEMPEKFYDFKVANAGDLYPETGEAYEVFAAAEVGNIFPLNTKFTVAHSYTYTDEQGKEQPVYMGSYGIGPSRLMGVIVETFHDERGIVWPEAVAPFQVHLISLRGGEDKAAALYSQLTEAKIEVIWDDRPKAGPGDKFSDADLIGCPVRILVGGKTEEGMVEWKKRSEVDSQNITVAEALRRLQK